MEQHRKICNDTKRRLIIGAYTDVKNNNKLRSLRLVDLCCGRGGDIFKWRNTGIDKVIAIDNHKDSIKEAINRYRKISKNTKTKISFIHKDVETLNLKKIIGSPVSIISCQFALHYFSDLSRFLKMVSDNLVVGGYFIGVAPDGDVIDFNLNNNVKIDNVVLERNEHDTGSDTGRDTSYFFKLVETEGGSTGSKTDNYFKYRDLMSKEYFVRKDNLKSKAAEHNLQLVSFNNLEGNRISGLYFSFVFIKVNS